MNYILNVINILVYINSASNHTGSASVISVIGLVHNFQVLTECYTKVAGSRPSRGRLLALGMEIMKYTLENIFYLSYYGVNNNTT